MKLKHINIFLMLLFIIVIGNLISVKLFDFGIFEVKPSVIELIEGLSMSYIAGYFVYFLTTQYPKSRNDKKRIQLVREEVEYKLNQINVRLKWLGIDKEDDKETYIKVLENITYDKVVSMRRSVTAYECLNQIKMHIEELRDFGAPLLLSTERSDLVEEFKKPTLRPAFLNPEMQYINKSLEELKGKKLDVSIYLFGLIASLKTLNSNLK